jgi:hypothetical protein
MLHEISFLGQTDIVKSTSTPFLPLPRVILYLFLLVVPFLKYLGKYSSAFDVVGMDFRVDHEIR